MTWGKMGAIQANCGIEVQLDQCMVDLGDQIMAAKLAQSTPHQQQQQAQAQQQGQQQVQGQPQQLLGVGMRPRSMHKLARTPSWMSMTAMTGGTANAVPLPWFLCFCRSRHLLCRRPIADACCSLTGQRLWALLRCDVGAKPSYSQPTPTACLLTTHAHSKPTQCILWLQACPPCAWNRTLRGAPAALRTSDARQWSARRAWAACTATWQPPTASPAAP